MREEWCAHWQPPQELPDRRGAFGSIATKANWRQIPLRPWSPPSYEAFRSALEAAKGSVGLDRLESSEAAAIARHAPWLVEELWQILVEGAEAIAEGEADGIWGEVLYNWRVVGIPKRLSDDSWPICVASVIARTWHRVLFDQLPAPEPQQ